MQRCRFVKENMMERRKLAKNAFDVPVLAFGTATFGGNNEFFKKWGTVDEAGARRMIDICLDHGVNFFDSANVYSGGMAEEILGSVLEGRRQNVLVSTKLGYPTCAEGTDFGASRKQVIEQAEASLRRLRTDYIDLLLLHGYDENTPIDETLMAFDSLIKAGKVRAIGASNHSGWQMMKALMRADALSTSRYVTHQVSYSLVTRDYENELQPLAYDQDVSAMVWSPLAGGKLSGKLTREGGIPAGTRVEGLGGLGSQAETERLFDIVDCLKRIAEEEQRTVPQVALAWVLDQPTVSSVVIGARNEEQLLANLVDADWRLDSRHVELLNQVSEVVRPYPYSHQRNFPMLLRTIAR